MSLSQQCSHLSTITNIPIFKIISGAKYFQCNDCDNTGPNLWMCMHKNCLKVGCSEKFNDHDNLHNESNPTHAVHVNLSTRRLWCYTCKAEVFMEEGDESRETDTSIIRESNWPVAANHESIPTPPELLATTKQGNNDGISDASENEDENQSSESNYGLVGLQNIGNTCYMNAALQALSNTIPLRNFFLECTPVVGLLTEGRKTSLSRIYQVLIRDMWIKKNCGYITPSGILYGIRSVHSMFRGFQQHDTQEFLRNFMDQLHEELKQVARVETVCRTEMGRAGDDETPLSSSHESSEAEYETCDSGVSERSSLSDEGEHHLFVAKQRLMRSMSPARRFNRRMSISSIDADNKAVSLTAPGKKQIQYRSIISDIFDGKLLSSVQCLTCNRVSSRVETFQDLSLPIPSRDHLAVLHERTTTNSMGGASSASCAEVVLPMDNSWFAWILSLLKSWFYGPTVSLHQCLAAFFSTDELKGDNMYSCEKCNKLRNGIKFSKVLQLPEVLCIHLKRFRHELMFSSKISSYVSFPMKGLDMSMYLHEECVSHVSTYELFSVICHHGTAGGGHYTCYSLNNGQWYEYDDQCVTRVNVDTVHTCEAYVLFYRKVSPVAQRFRERLFQIAEHSLDYDDEDVTYISKQWLNRFKTCSEPGPIDNSDFLCPHGLIHPERVTIFSELVMMLPRTLYDLLHKTFGGCAAQPHMQICAPCQLVEERALGEFERFHQLKRDQQQQRHLEPPTHLIALDWYQQWLAFVQRRVCEPPGAIDNGRLVAGKVEGGGQSVEVSEEMWHFFHGVYGGGPEVRINQSKRGEETRDERMSEDTDDASTNRVVVEEEEHEMETKAEDRAVYCHGEPAGTIAERMNGNGSCDETIREDNETSDGGDEVDVVEEPMECANGVADSSSMEEDVDATEETSSPNYEVYQYKSNKKSFKSKRNRHACNNDKHVFNNCIK